MSWEERGGGVGGHMWMVGVGKEGMEVRLERRRRAWHALGGSMFCLTDCLNWS